MLLSELIAFLRTQIAGVANVNDVFSPKLPLDTKQKGHTPKFNQVSIETLSAFPQIVLSKNLKYIEVTYLILLRGNKNNIATLSLAESIFNELNAQTDVNIPSSTRLISNLGTDDGYPSYAFTDEQNRIHYKFQMKATISNQ